MGPERVRIKVWVPGGPNPELLEKDRGRPVPKPAESTMAVRSLCYPSTRCRRQKPLDPLQVEARKSALLDCQASTFPRQSIPSDTFRNVREPTQTCRRRPSPKGTRNHFNDIARCNSMSLDRMEVASGLAGVVRCCSIRGLRLRSFS